MSAMETETQFDDIVTGGNTDAPSMMSGETAADTILGRPAVPPAWARNGGKLR
ncbi:hypothetical protein AB4Z48_27135 [Cupriavidus sp. 2TAF22]|uniref:hypothetical protein n=1 Tax=unclassified Cupriavidus TaxID=2640874 RepID=UPI003F931577